MSLTSGYELSQEPGFRAKVVIALVKAARKIVADNEQEGLGPTRTAFAKDILNNVNHYAERAFVILAADDSIDDASDDKKILDATRKAILDLTR